MGKENIEVCECCGQVLNTFKFNLTRSLSESLKKLAGCGSVNFNTKDLRDRNIISSSDYTNITHLRYLGLVDKIIEKDGTRGEGRLWTLTQLGVNYLNNKPVHQWVKVKGREVIEKSTTTQCIKDAFGFYEPPPYWKILSNDFDNETGQCKLF
jgi:hypothetical protein